MSEVDRKSQAILGDLKTIQCDDKLGPLDMAAQDIHDAFVEYNGTGDPLTDSGSLMKRTQRELALAAANPGYVMADLRPRIRGFTDKRYAMVQAALANINAVLMNENYKSSPLGVCLDKAFVAYQTKTGEKQFDDRQIWRGIYWIVQKTMVDQALGVQMLLDMNKFAAITALSDPAVEPATPVIPDGVEWQAENLCAKAQAHSSDPNPRWQRAFEACDRLSSV